MSRVPGVRVGAATPRAACGASTQRAARVAAPAVAVLALLLVSLQGCGTSGAARPVTEVTAKIDASGVQSVTIEVHSYYFEPSRVVVKAGVPVELTIRFKSFFTPHNLTCANADAGIEIDKSAGFMSFKKTKRATFTPTTPGEYAFHCGVGSHMTKGMTGTLVVR